MSNIHETQTQDRKYRKLSKQIFYINFFYLFNHHQPSPTITNHYQPLIYTTIYYYSIPFCMSPSATSSTLLELPHLFPVIRPHIFTRKIATTSW